MQRLALQRVLTTAVIAAFLSCGAFAREQAAQVRLVMAGDVMVAEEPGELIAQGHDPFAAVAKYFPANRLRIANLECVIATTGQAEIKPFTFRAAPAAIPTLRRYFDAVTVANNHSGDFGKPAFAEQLGLLEAAHLPYFGGGRDLAAAHQPWIVNRNGLRIAFRT
jgi:poly-gamma-glutamate synthesis protein (capsule biosynthesis protein)